MTSQDYFMLLEKAADWIANQPKYKQMIIKIVTLRYGNTTLEEIGKSVGKTRERIRQILFIVNRKIRWYCYQDCKI